MSTDAARLPYVDEHSIEIEAGAEATWDAALRIVDGSFASGPSSTVARLLGCADVDAAGPRPLVVGSSVPGFHVETAEPPRQLGLGGAHRFSRYALIFRLDALEEGRTRLRAETRAEFPGLKGRAYRALVIGTRGHVLMLRRLLAAAKRRAERTPRPVQPRGLCDSCAHQRLVPNTRDSVFSLCLRSRSQAEYPRYPPLPVLRCAGHEPRPSAANSG